MKTIKEYLQACDGYACEALYGYIALFSVLLAAAAH